MAEPWRRRTKRIVAAARRRPIVGRPKEGASESCRATVDGRVNASLDPLCGDDGRPRCPLRRPRGRDGLARDASRPAAIATDAAFLPGGST
ncbi:hypothetical protein [Halegenticoccus tardaugens]|uniref:hypothetical protein n=1 Tax=Halegenticoccus tardaugens TaxID=2071624 RepID=UPI00100AA8F2|nr:hypothetical protein [Halegenticoccus tardaugens]